MYDFYTKSSSITELNDVLNAAKEFFDETEFSKLSYDGERYKEVLTNFYHDPEAEIITAWDDNNLCGYIIIFYVREYTKENIGEVYQFYVRKKYRKTIVGRLLVNKAEERFDDWKCAVRHSSVDPRMIENTINNSLFCNLWKKFGYKTTGTLLTKDTNCDGKDI